MSLRLIEDPWASSMTGGPLGQAAHKHDSAGAEGSFDALMRIWGFSEAASTDTPTPPPGRPIRPESRQWGVDEQAN